MIFCEKCGFKMNEGDKFCFNCGAPSRARTPEASNTQHKISNIDLHQSSGATEVLNKSRGKEAFAVFQYNENGKAKEFMMSERMINIGRDPKQCELIIASDKYISRNHALIYLKNKRFYLVDLNSKNWTFINGKRIQGIGQLENECTLKFAKTEVKFKANV